MSTHTPSPITVYRPNQRHELGFFQTWVVMTRNVIQSRELIWQLFKRDFLVAYKKSFIGIFWIFVSPLTGIVSWLFLKETGILAPGDVGVPYPVYVLIGTSVWSLFAGFKNDASTTLSAGSEFIMQVNYPHEALLFKQIAQHLANFSIQFGANLVLMLAIGVIPDWKIIFFPIVALPLFFLGTAIGLIIGMIKVVAIDVNKVFDAIFGLLMWITPIIYSDQIKYPIVKVLIKWNPLTYLACSARDIIIYGRLYDNAGFAICAGLSLLLFLISWRLFYVSENKLVERMI